MEVVANTRVHQLRHLQQLEQLLVNHAQSTDLRVILERLLALVVLCVGFFDLLREGRAGVFHGRNVLAGSRYGALQRVDLIQSR